MMLLLGLCLAVLASIALRAAFHRGYALGERHGRETEREVQAQWRHVSPPLTADTVCQGCDGTGGPSRHCAGCAGSGVARTFAAPWLSPEYAAEIGPEMDGILTRLKSRTPLS